MTTSSTELPLASSPALLDAIEADELCVHYQAIYSLPTRTIIGYEALIRWEHPRLGLLRPDEFLPTDMGGGLGWTLTTFVLDRALAQCARWRTVGRDVGVSVNISPGPLAGELLPSRVLGLLAHHGVPASSLTMEITEHRCSMDPGGIVRASRELADAGVRFSLDDFGTGDSTLSRLREMRFDELKIDRSFVYGLAEDRTDRNIVRHVTELAHSLGSTVVAEGIESPRALEAVCELGVDAGQGFLLHRPEAPT